MSRLRLDTQAGKSIGLITRGLRKPSRRACQLFGRMASKLARSNHQQPLLQHIHIAQVAATHARTSTGAPSHMAICPPLIPKKQSWREPRFRTPPKKLARSNHQQPLLQHIHIAQVAPTHARTSTGAPSHMAICPPLIPKKQSWREPRFRTPPKKVGSIQLS